MNLADLPCPGDPDGRTYREINAARTHTIPIGTLVELPSGVRLFVVCHGRDCDEAPIYYLSHDRRDTARLRKGMRNPSWTGGYGEMGLRVVTGKDGQP